MAPTGETVMSRGEFLKLVLDHDLYSKHKSDPQPWKSVIQQVRKMVKNKVISILGVFILPKCEKSAVKSVSKRNLDKLRCVKYV